MDATPAYIESTFSRRPIYDGIFSGISAVDITRVGCTSRLLRAAAQEYSVRAYSINRHLSRFFNDPIGFRSLQAQTGTLISGSNALQFMDRTIWPDSDMDVYTHPGFAKRVGQWLIEKEGFLFAPSAEQPATFLEAVPPWTPFHERKEIDEIVEDAMAGMYPGTGIHAIYTFKKEKEDRTLSVQIISSNESPFACILGFHSTCVMNFIAYNAAYSLYPYTTFERRLTLSMRRHKYAQLVVLKKYHDRGWRPVRSSTWPNQSFYVERNRRVGDRHTWTIPFDLTDVEGPCALSPSSKPLTNDPVVENSWMMVDGRDFFGKAVVNKMRYFTLTFPVLRYVYGIAEQPLYMVISNAALDKERLQPMSSDGNLDEDFLRESGWKWWDELVPEVREAYYRRVRERSSSAGVQRSDTEDIRRLLASASIEQAPY